MKKMFMQLHLGLALFFMPFVLLFILTGVLHLLGSKETNLEEIKSFTFVGKENFENIDSKKILYNTVKDLIKNDKYKYKKKRYLSLETKTLVAVLKPRASGYDVVVSNRTPFGILLNLHKGKGLSGKIVSYGFSAGLLCLLISGFVMINRRKYKLMPYVFMGVGLGVLLGLYFCKF